MTTPREPDRCLQVRVQVMPEADGLGLPEYQTLHAAGMDLRAAIPEPVTLAPGERTLLSVGLRIAVPVGYEAQIRPRSGLALRSGLAVLNSPGTIDADYRGTVQVILANLGAEPITINRGDRIAQLVVCPVQRVEWEPVAEVPPTDRGEGGFGHTGK
jgi:dUTP pyrophosphatase